MWGRSSTEAFTIAASNNASTAAWTAEGPSARWGRGGRRPRASKFTSKDRGRSCPPHGRSHEGTPTTTPQNTGKHHNWWPFEPSPLLPIILRGLAMMYFQLQQLAPLRTEQRLCCCGLLHFLGVRCWISRRDSDITRCVLIFTWFTPTDYPKADVNCGNCYWWLSESHRKVHQLILIR